MTIATLPVNLPTRGEARPCPRPRYQGRRCDCSDGVRGVREHRAELIDERHREGSVVCRQVSAARVPRQHQNEAPDFPSVADDGKRNLIARSHGAIGVIAAGGDRDHAMAEVRQQRRVGRSLEPRASRAEDLDDLTLDDRDETPLGTAARRELGDAMDLVDLAATCVREPSASAAPA